MRVDFYQLGGSATLDGVVTSIAGRLISEKQRLLVTMADEAAIARLDRQLWDQGPASFLPHGVAGGVDDSAQPVLLSQFTDAPNGARNILLGDGEWRDAALGYDRAFYVFDEPVIDAARLAWKLLAGREGVERNYWAQEEGRWVKKA
ncbi:DNA polymerase III subunit chi [Sphingomonas rhizophila]|uniref:DNA polymerase III subunit chi n=1 Tax=Sphingomonas rhizophila TaxID=2071607 RepID=A0A7G9SDP4_9SPHN|nr:DNA polymerase III subunit chi [Sphingomonas rhizophila]QNN65969.1 DNA polymerase III subunit chi [Sphingomonas rhizophila]